MIEAYQKNLLKDFPTWFTALGDLAKCTQDTSSLPKLEVFLQSGNSIRGSIIGSQGVGQDELLMILEVSEVDARSKITLVHRSQIVSLSLLDPNAYLKLFSSPENKVIVGELELKRKAKTTEESLERIVSGKITLNLYLETLAEEQRGAILRTTELLPAVFESLTAEDIGKQLVSSSIKELGIRIGTLAQSTLKDTHLTIEVPLQLSIPLHKEKERITQSIEKLL
jgi:hypothetical protein